MAVVLLTGMTDGAEQRLSDAWFAAGNIKPSGRTVLVTFNHRAARYARTNQVPHGDLAEILLRLDAAGVSRILIEFGLSDQANEADDRLLERVLTELGPKVALPAIAVLSANQTSLVSDCSRSIDLATMRPARRPTSLSTVMARYAISASRIWDFGI